MVTQHKLAGTTIVHNGDPWSIDGHTVPEATLDRFVAIAQVAALERLARVLESSRTPRGPSATS